MLLCLPRLITTAAPGSWCGCSPVAFLRMALNNTYPPTPPTPPPTTTMPPPSLSKWEESAKDGEEGCLFELGAEHQTHFQMYKLFPSAGAKKHFVVFFLFFTDFDSSQLRLRPPSNAGRPSKRKKKKKMLIVSGLFSSTAQVFCKGKHRMVWSRRKTRVATHPLQFISTSIFKKNNNINSAT